MNRTDSLIPYGQYCTVQKVLYRRNSIVPFGPYFTVWTVFYRTDSILAFVYYCTVRIVLYLTDSFFPVRTVLALKDSFLPEALYCSVRSKNSIVRTVFHRKDSIIPFCQCYTVLTVIFLSESIVSYAQNFIFKFFTFFLKILYFCPN